MLDDSQGLKRPSTQTPPICSLRDWPLTSWSLWIDCTFSCGKTERQWRNHQAFKLTNCFGFSPYLYRLDVLVQIRSCNHRCYFSCFASPEALWSVCLKTNRNDNHLNSRISAFQLDQVEANLSLSPKGRHLNGVKPVWTNKLRSKPYAVCSMLLSPEKPIIVNNFNEA